MKPAADTHPRALTPAQNLPGTATAPGYASTFPGRADQLGQLRHEIATYLAGCPAADDITLIASDSLNLLTYSFGLLWCVFVSGGWMGCRGLPWRWGGGRSG